MNIREWTLPVYTVLTQLSVGALLVIMIIRTFIVARFESDKADKAIKVPVLILFSTALFAILFAHFHLSRPYLSFLALRNLASSWLSREILTNLTYLLFLGIFTLSLWRVNGLKWGRQIMAWLAVLSGLTTDFCMSRIYLLPSQPAWDSFLTPISFLITTFLLGVVTIPVLLSMDLIFKQAQGQTDQTIHLQLIDQSLGKLSVTAAGLCILTATIIYFQVASLTSGIEAARASLELLLRIYQPLLILRLVLLFIGVGWLAVGAVQMRQKQLAADNMLLRMLIACLLVMVAEILGRFLFYAIHVRVGL
jgi:anaerobic dimethyl sulfoxide reductase subunit C (anchor subunit)